MPSRYLCTRRHDCRCNECRSAMYPPTPDQIDAECEAIRRRWSQSQCSSRLACDAARRAAADGYVVPVICLDQPEDAVDALWRE